MNSWAVEVAQQLKVPLSEDPDQFTTTTWQLTVVYDPGPGNMTPSSGLSGHQAKNSDINIQCSVYK